MVEQMGIVGSAHLVPGGGDRAVLELRQEHPNPGDGTNLVLTMAGSRIVAMEGHRRTRKARRVAEVG